MGEFENKSQAELHSMVAQASPKEFYDRASALGEAALHMDQLSQEIQKHVNSVEWQGSGGDAFRSWGQQLVNTTSDFSTYTSTVSGSLYSVASSLSTAVAGIKPPLVTPIVPFPGMQRPIDGAMPLADTVQREESINLMTSLASSYSTAATHFTAQPPVFSPMPAAMMPGGGDFGEPQTGLGEGGGEGNGPSGDSGANAPARHAVVRPVSDDGDGHVLTLPTAPHVPTGHTTLDSLPPGTTITLPPGTSPVPLPGHPTGPGTATLPPLGTSPLGTPPYGGGGWGGGGGGEDEIPGMPPLRTTGGTPADPGGRAGGRGLPEEDGIFGGTSGGRTGAGRSGLVVGAEEEPSMPRMPGGSGTGGPSGGYGRTPGGSYRPGAGARARGRSAASRRRSSPAPGATAGAAERSARAPPRRRAVLRGPAWRAATAAPTPPPRAAALPPAPVPTTLWRTRRPG